MVFVGSLVSFHNSADLPCFRGVGGFDRGLVEVWAFADHKVRPRKLDALSLDRVSVGALSLKTSKLSL